MHGSRDVRLSEVLSALTYALDLTEGQRPGHTVRTAIIAMRLGRESGLSSAQLEALYFAALLKDAGCSSNAARMAALFGSDDQQVKKEMRLVDWHDRFRLAIRTAASCGIGRNPLARMRHFLMVATTPSMTREIIQARCERGAQIAALLGFAPETSTAINHVDEHWCGLGHPAELAGEEIPLLSRILLLSQTLEAYWGEYGLPSAMEMAQHRRARWFDPSLVDRVVGWRRDAAWWRELADVPSIDARVVSLEPSATPLPATAERLDTIAQAFAFVIDAKTPFTYHHSTNVARYAVAIGSVLGLPDRELRQVLHAGLLHDIGKLGVSNRILDKPARLSEAERREMMKHPRWTLEILARVPAFDAFAAAASHHHERIDGAGYPFGLSAGELSVQARILAVADVYEALTAHRPYRAGLTSSQSVHIMADDVGTAFDATVFDAMQSLAAAGSFAELASMESATTALELVVGRRGSVHATHAA